MALSPSTSSRKLTADQARAIESMRSCLRCQLCDKMLVVPATLMACNHSFCRACITKYTEDNWICPGEGDDFAYMYLSSII